MKATQKNICNVLGTEAKALIFTRMRKGNGYKVRGMMRRYALTDLMNNFHVYIAKDNSVVIITPGRLNTDNKV